jgi:hypothetical protein
MRVLLVSSAFNSMTQRFFVEVSDAGHGVAVEDEGRALPLLSDACQPRAALGSDARHPQTGRIDTASAPDGDV